MKKLFFTVLTSIFTLSLCFSQDIITKKSGEDIQSKVIELTTTEIKYKRFESQNGPTYSILKSDVLILRYKDGTKETFTEEKKNETVSAPVTVSVQKPKGYIGVSFGASFPSGSLTNLENAMIGVNLGLINAGYRFTETYGLTFNWGSTAYNCKFGFDEYTLGIGYLAIGPIFSFHLRNKIELDLKPQIAFTTIINNGSYTSGTDSSTGLLFGSSINYPLAKNWGLAFNLDYLSTKFNSENFGFFDTNYKANAFNTSLGIQYKF